VARARLGTNGQTCTAFEYAVFTTPMAWQRLPTRHAELSLSTTLRCGQAFRWRASADGEWSMALSGRVLSLRQDADAVHFRALFPPDAPSSAIDDTPALVAHYLNLAPNLVCLYAQWAAADATFGARAPGFPGIRVLRQDPWETLLAFICSSNNHISRIGAMVHKLCLHYGPLIASLDGVPYHDVPTPEALSGPAVEAHLQQLGFGYRAKYIAKTARIVAADKGLAWLESLSNPEFPPFRVTPVAADDVLDHGGHGGHGYRHAHDQLLALPGVGPKVADCVCLFGLGWSEAVPVDTHVWHIAKRDYKFGRGKQSSLTATTYHAIGDHFRKLWGKEAGWAHAVLFTADLKAFSSAGLAADMAVKQDDGPVKREGDEHQARPQTKGRKRVKMEPEDEERVVQDHVQVATTRRSKRHRGQPGCNAEGSRRQVDGCGVGYQDLGIQSCGENM